jgi:CRISPR/Cas system CSM-associated protein Csm3 (group 7 of RAMP superfamily)
MVGCREMLGASDKGAEQMSSNTYKFIQVDGIKRRMVRSYIPHSSFREAHRIQVFLRTESPVHVGSGEIGLHENLPLLLNARLDGKLAIPGSTLKGVISHYYLALTGDISSTSSLFGSPGYMSRALFSDSLPEGLVEPKIIGIGPSWQPARREMGKIKLYRNDIEFKEEKKQYYLECIPQGTVLKADIVVFNPVKMETAKLILSMGHASYDSKIFLLGFGKPRGLGKIRVSNLRVLSVDSLGKEKEITNEVMDDVDRTFQEVKGRFSEVFGSG